MFEAHAIEQAVDRFTVPLGTLDSGRLQHIAGIYQRHGLLDEHFRVDRRTYFDRPAGEADILTEEESHFLQQHEVIRVAVDPSWYPMEFVDESGQHGGIAADYLALLSQRLGISFDIAQDVSWSDAVTMVRERELDMFSMAAQTPERAQFALFTQPYIRSPMVIVTDVGVDYIDNPERLYGRKVAVVRGYASHEWLENNHPAIPLHLVETTVEGLERVATGEVYALVDNLASVTFLIKQRGLSNLKVSGQLPLDFDLAMGVRSDWPELRSILQKGLDAISQEERDAIYDKWVRLEVETSLDISKVAPYFIVLLLILALVSLDAWRVRRLHRRLHDANQQLHLAEQRLIEQNQQLEQLSVTDKLTGVYNRLKLDDVLQQQLALAERYQRPVSVVIFDLDNFKHVNDTHGHHVGDQVLQRFAELVLGIARKSDIFGRWGGEEFLLICPETTAWDAADLANRVREQLAGTSFDEVGRQTVSCGVAELRPSQSLSDWISQADKRLYQAKQQGRNRVVGD
jgi:polar amino acid transport system substrate-binding protein